MTHNFNFEENSTDNPFCVPDGYFEDFALKMDRAIKPVEISIWQKSKPYLYVAAMFVMIFAVGLIFYRTNKLDANIAENRQVTVYSETANEILLDDVNEDILTEYILANASYQLQNN
ncbi:MAG: hypothetical protein LBT04_01475 [Prevotellaceae bacterium]|jgi:hypothetical protein|nr:hypothetical protein [Prevotellaceae bacterium]